ncbi:MAG: amino acid ABC transporter substrate-binding protein, partial [Bacilli bacterium]|nr:amino acid ABC transporter substrate-binding protein [Bacilli bacterium]
MKTFMNKQRWTLCIGFVSLFLLASCGNDDSKNGANESEKPITAWDKIQEEGSLTVATSGTLFPT